MAKKRKKFNSISCECDFTNTDLENRDESMRAIDCRCSNDKDMEIIETKKLSIFDVGDPD